MLNTFSINLIELCRKHSFFKDLKFRPRQKVYFIAFLFYKYFMVIFLSYIHLPSTNPKHNISEFSGKKKKLPEVIFHYF